MSDRAAIEIKTKKQTHMPAAKPTLVRLEGLLLTVCDDLRGYMDASDLFDQRRKEIKKEGGAARLSEADVALNLEDLLPGNVPVVIKVPELVDG